MAIATRLPIVPVVVKHAHKRWPAKSFTISPGVIEIDVLEAIPTDDWTADNLDEMIEKVRSLYIQHLPEEQQPLST